MENSPAEVAILICGCALSGAIVVPVLRDLWSWRLFRKGGPSWKGIRKAFISRCFADRKKCEDREDVLDALAAEHVRERMKNNVRNIQHTASMVYTMTALTIIINIVLQVPRWMTLPQTCIVLILMAVGIVMQSFPESITHDRLLVWQSIMQPLGAAWALLGDTSSAAMILFNVSAAWMFRFLYAVTFPKTYLVAVWTAIYVLASCYTFSRIQEEEGEPVSLRMFIIYEVVMNAGLLLCVVFTARFSLTTSKQYVQATIMEGETSATSRMLDLMCDVSIELDRDLRIKEHAPNFEAMMAVGADKSAGVKGAPFQEFMAPGDGEALEERLLDKSLSGHSSRGLGAGAMESNLRDYLGNSIRVELFFVRYQRLDGMTYLVGLREVSDQPIGTLKRFQSSKAARAVLAAGAEKELPGGGAVRPSLVGKGTQSVVPSRPLGAPDLDGPLGAPDQDGPLGAPDQDEVCSNASDGSASSTSSVGSGLSYSSKRNGRAGITPGGVGIREFKPTSSRAKRVAVARAMQRWNIASTRQWCCSLHALVAELQRSCGQLQRMPCEPGFFREWNAQCHECGTLDYLDPAEDPVCTLCRRSNWVRSNMASL